MVDTLFCTNITSFSNFSHLKHHNRIKIEFFSSEILKAKPAPSSRVASPLFYKQSLFSGYSVSSNLTYTFKTCFVIHISHQFPIWNKTDIQKYIGGRGTKKCFKTCKKRKRLKFIHHNKKILPTKKFYQQKNQEER